jgi:hypothetical protein
MNKKIDSVALSQNMTKASLLTAETSPNMSREKQSVILLLDHI